MNLLHYFKLYLALIVFLATTWSIVIESYFLVEAAFKAAIVMLALIAFEYSFKLQIKRGKAISLAASAIITLFYFMSVGSIHTNAAIAAYLCLILLISLSFGKPRDIYSFVIEELPLHYVALAFYWIIVGSRDIALSTTMLAVVLAVSVVKALTTKIHVGTASKEVQSSLERTAIELHLLEEASALSKVKARLEAVWSVIGHKATLLLEFLQNKVVSEVAAVNGFKAFNEFVKALLKAENNNVLQTMRKLAKLAASIMNSFIKVERRIGEILHTISSSIEMLQHSMERSFLLLLFLMSVLLLVAILFYITFTALQ